MEKGFGRKSGKMIGVCVSATLRIYVNPELLSLSIDR